METQIPRQASDFELQEFEDELLLYHPAETATFYLNPQAALIWRLCAGSRCIADLIAVLEEAYPDQQERIRDDVLQTIRQFVRQGALTLD